MKKYIDTGKKDTRSGFGAGLLEAGKADPRVVALTADLKGSLKMDAFAEAFPDRFIQCGIAEANMVGVAAGLAITGKMSPPAWPSPARSPLRVLSPNSSPAGSMTRSARKSPTA